ncbi:MAG: SUMF1/EgtB/PvdO family nonheme iron enzyme [Candidatus Cloacimonetes bacterium]|nr:SUMF1/EgtB/PvdO family nonheme iron enzyme [Candidatus Cloacimonadota bacterium]
MMKIKKESLSGIIILAIMVLTVTGCDSRSTGNGDLDDMTGTLLLEALSDSQVRINWNSNPDVDEKYVLERGSNDGAYSLLVELTPDETVYIDTALTVGVLYRYRLSGVNGDKQTNYLESSIEMTFAGITSFSSQGEGIHLVHLSWVHDCAYESGYLLERMTGEGSEFVEYAVLDADVFSFDDSLAVPGQALSYRIRAFTEYNESAGKTVIELLTFPSVADLAVQQLDVNCFQLSWSDMSIGEESYIIERRIDAGPNEKIAILPENSEDYIDDISVREQIESISWWVKAVYLEYESNEEVITADVVFPAPHIELIEELSLTSARIIWEDRSNGETGFTVDRKVDNGNWENGVGEAGANATEWIDEDMTLLSTYYYRVTAYSSNNESNPSSLYYYEQRFPQPDGLVYDIESFGAIHLTWNDNSVGEEGFRLDRRILGQDWVIGFLDFPANTEEYTDTDLTSGILVSYRIYAFLGETVTYPDILYNIEVVVAPPSGFYYTVENIHTINLLWTDDIGGEDGYRIDRLNDGNWTTGIGETGAGVEGWTDSNVPVNDEVRYRVYAFAGEFLGEAAETQVIFTDIPAPMSLTWALEGLSAVRLDWVDGINGENGFTIDRYTETGGWQVAYDAIPANTETWTDNAVTYGNILRYRVYAYYGEDAGAYAETIEIVVELPAPENLLWQRQGLTEIALSWTDVINGEDAYIIDRQLEGEDWVTEYAVLSANSVSYNDVGLELETRVKYRVYGRTGVNPGATAETDWIEMDFPAPEDFMVTFTAPSQLDFTWNYGIEGIDGFYIENYSFSGGWEEFISGIPANAESWTGTGSNWNIFRIVAYLGTEHTATSQSAGIAPEGFAAVTGGIFEMGDHFLEGDNDELPVHEVEISGFYVSAYEVTQASYTQLMGANPSLNQGNEFPVENLEWLDAINYCNSRSTDEGFTACYTIDGEDVTCDWNADGYRLLTEAEWEYAARGGVNWEDDYRYSGTTDNLGNYAVYTANDPNHPAEAGSKLANQLGIYDMSGNVWEMCWDFYDNNYYAASEYTDPTGPEEGFSRVTRGGGYNSNDESCRVANRYNRDESYNDGNLGFRICRRK